MTVLEVDQIDGMGKSQDGRQLLFLIIDHLDWEQEGEHLLVLQEKINAYLSFIESEQYADHYPKERIHEFVIEIHFLHAPTEKCEEFLAVVGEQLQPFHISIAVGE